MARAENMPKTESIDEVLKIGEIRTMASDIARIRLSETKKEIERMTGLGTVEQKRKEMEKKKQEQEEKIRKQEEIRQKELEKKEEKRRAEEKKKEDEEMKKKKEQEKTMAMELEKEKEVVEEIKQKAREEAKEIQGKQRVLAEIKEEEDLKRKGPELRGELEKLVLERKPLEKEKDRLLERKKEMETILSPILKREEVTEEKIKLLEDQEKKAETVQGRQEIEKARWNLEQKRKEIEKKRWAREEEIQKLASKIANTELRIGELRFQEEKIKSKIEEAEARIEEIKLERKKFHIIEDLEKIPQMRIPLANKEAGVLSQKNKFLQTLQEVSESEDKIEQEKTRLEEQEKTAQTVQERQRIEKARWNLEGKRKEIEKKRWGQEGKIQTLNLEIKAIDEKLKEVAEQEKKLKEKIREIDFALLKLTAGEKGVIEPEAIPMPEMPAAPEMPETITTPEPSGLPAISEEPEIEKELEKTRAQRLEEARRRVEALKRKAQAEIIKQPKTEISPPEPKPQEEPEIYKRPKIFSERPEIFTAPGQSKIERLRTSPQGLEDLEEPMAPFEKAPVEIFRPLPKKPSSGERNLVRILVVILSIAILACILTFWYWYLTQRGKPSPPSPITEEEQPAPPVEEEDEAIPPEEAFPPAALILIENAQTLEITGPEELPSRLAATLQQDFGEDEFTRILIKDTAENRFLGLKDFFEIFQIKSPEGFLENLGNDFTPFLYSFEKENRLGFAAKINDPSGFSSLVKSWEATMESDLENLFLILGKTENATASFKEAQHQGKTFHYLSFPQKEFGICWLVFDNYFVLTSSGKTMFQTIEILK